MDQVTPEEMERLSVLSTLKARRNRLALSAEALAYAEEMDAKEAVLREDSGMMAEIRDWLNETHPRFEALKRPPTMATAVSQVVEA